MSAPFMQLYVADYLGDTRHLTTEQHGAYLLLLMTMWRSEGSLPNDDKKLARLAGCTSSRWAKIKAEVMEFFTVEGEEITNARLKFELEKASEKSIKRAEAGTKGGKAKALKSHKSDIANATGLPCHSSEPEPEEPPKPLSLAPLARLLDLCSQGDWSTLVSEVHDLQPKTGGKRKTTTPDVRDALAAAIKRGGRPADIRKAVAAYYALPDCVRDDGRFSMGAKVLLAKDRWREFLPTPKPDPSRPADPAVRAHRLQHFAKTGEWKPTWGDRPPANDQHHHGAAA